MDGLPGYWEGGGKPPHLAVKLPKDIPQLFGEML